MQLELPFHKSDYEMGIERVAVTLRNKPKCKTAYFYTRSILLHEQLRSELHGTH